MGQARILLVEDAADLARIICKTLVEEGFEVVIASTGVQALREAEKNWSLVILDLMLPDFSGEAVLRFLSKQPVHPPVLVVTARNRLEDKLSLFRQGCDDYLIKPFDIEELLERVRALMRRPVRVASGPLQLEDLELDPVSHRLAAGGKEVALTPKEAAICQVLMQSPGQVISRIEILQTVWGLSAEPNTNFLGVHLLNLRKKFSQLGRETWLQTVRSSGFVVSRPEGERPGH